MIVFLIKNRLLTSSYSHLTANSCKTTNSRAMLKSAGILSAAGYLECISISSNCLKTMNAANRIAVITVLPPGHQGLNTLRQKRVCINAGRLSTLSKHRWGRCQLCQTWNSWRMPHYRQGGGQHRESEHSFGCITAPITTLVKELFSLQHFEQDPCTANCPLGSKGRKASDSSY